jgi:hypothetical protein
MMVVSTKKYDSKTNALNANQKISLAITQIDEALNFYEGGNGELQKALRNFVEVRHLSIDELQDELIDALWRAEIAEKKQKSMRTHFQLSRQLMLLKHHARKGEGQKICGHKLHMNRLNYI